MSDRQVEPSLGLAELLAIAVGGMIGGGIFSILGLAVSISGNATPLAFLVGAFIASFAGYSYVKLALSVRNDGASFTYLERAFPQWPNLGALAGWTVLLGYVGTLALYAYTFGAYAANLVGSPGSAGLRVGLSVSILVVFMLVNLAGARATGTIEIGIVVIKVVLLIILAIAGFFSFDSSRLTPVFDQGIDSIFIAGALIFVAFEGFQLVTNAVVESRDPERNVPAAIYGSIIIVVLVYLSIAFVALGTLGHGALVEFQEYALAEVAKPVLGTAGGVLVGVAALFSTSSAINGTAFGASRMLAEMAQSDAAPRAMSFRNRKQVPWAAIVALTFFSILLTAFNQLETVAAFSSITFLLICAVVGLSNLKLSKMTGSNRFIVVVGIILTLVALGLLLEHLATSNIPTLAKVAGMYLAVTAIELLFSRRGRIPLLH